LLNNKYFKNKMIRKLVARILLLLLLLYGTTYFYFSYGYLYFYSENNTEWVYLNRMLSGQLQHDSVKTLLLGESRLNAAINTQLIDHSLMFAPGGATSIENYYALQKYLKSHKKPETVFLSISPRFMSELFAFWEYACRNDFFTFSEINEIVENNSKLENSDLLGNFVFLKFMSYRLKYLAYYQGDMFDNHLFFAKNRNVELLKDLYLNHGERMYPQQNGSSELNYETHYTSFKYEGLLDFYFHKILNECKEQKIHLISESIPMNYSSHKKLSDNFVKTYQVYMKTIQNQYPEFSISDSLYSFPDSLYGDASHLNLKGKQLFSELMLQKYFSTKNHQTH